MRFLVKLGLCSGLVFGLSACGGGGSSTQPSSSNSNSNIGTFIDSPVMGLSYETASHSGVTNSAGEFNYADGETVSFSLGGIELGSSLAQDEVTPLDLLGVESIDEAISTGVMDQLINMLVFLQSLDRDHNSDNGIDLGDLDSVLADEELVFDQDQELFQASAFKRIVNENAGAYVKADQAQKHFVESLGVSYTAELPSKDYLDIDGDSFNDIEISYHYDDNGKLIEIFEASTGGVDRSPTARTTLQYDNESRLSILVYEDLESEVRLMSREYSYDAMGRLIYLVEAGPDEGILLEESWEYDEVGNPLRHQHSITPDGVSTYESNKNPFDLFYNIKPYSPDNNIQAPLASYFDRNLEDFYQNTLGGEFLEISSYGDDGELVSKVDAYTINVDSSVVIISQNEATYENGRKLSNNSEADIEAFELFVQFEIIYNYAEDDSPISCTFTSSQNEEVTDEFFISFEPEIGDMVTYSCGDLGFNETIVFRDEEDKVQTILYNVYISSSWVERNEQTIIYDESQLVGILTESLTDQNGFISQTTSSSQYEYTDLDNLKFIEQSSDGLKTWTREHRSVEIR